MFCCYNSIMSKLIDNVLFLVISIAATTKANPLAGGVPVESVLEHPFIAALLRNGNCFCGGSIIDKRNILTAAHCMVDLYYNQVKVAVGTINWMDVPKGHKYNVEAWAIHKAFRAYVEPNTGENDIALIRLNRDIDFSTGSVQPMSLDSTNFLQNSDTIFLFGYGPTGNKCELRTHFLHELESFVWNIEKHFKKTFPDRPGLMEKVYCTLGSSKMACKNPPGRFTACPGDSGGPVIAKDPVTKKWKLVALIASANTKITMTVRVFAFLDWINETKLKLFFDNFATIR